MTKIISIQSLNYKNMFKKSDKFSKKIKHLIQDLKSKKYNKNTHYSLLKFNAFGHQNLKLNDSLDLVNIANMQHLEDVHKLHISKVVISNIIEKYIVYTNSTQKADLNFEDLKEYHNIISHSGHFRVTDNFLSELMFKIANEQFIHQSRNYSQYKYRMISIFEECEVSQKYLFDNLKLDIIKISALYLILLSFILNKNKVIINFSISTFKKYVLNAQDEHIINEEDIDNFLNFILIDFQTFKEKYFNIRKDKNSLLMSYDKLNEVDKYLPKVSFIHPFIKINSDTVSLVSYTGLMQFMHLENIFYYIAGQEGVVNRINKYRIKILGNLLEQYIFKLAINYKNNHNSNINIIFEENKKYKIGKQEFEVPDIILIQDNNIIFIESKSSPFNLIAAIQDFNEDKFASLNTAINTSNKNINRFIEHNPLSIENLDSMIMHKIVCFNVVESMMLGSLSYSNFIDAKDFIISDLNSLEVLFNIKSPVNIYEPLNDFRTQLSERDVHSSTSLYNYCQDNYEIDYSLFDDITNEKLYKIFKDVKKDGSL